VIVRSRGLRLEEAAALNANFPPVFSNAAIDVDDKTRYWVTDGGAVDNRGLEMLLYAMRLALDEWRRSGLPLPAIHVVIADASAFSDAYGQDRGIGSAFGAGSRYASHLNAELAASIRQLYQAEPSRFRVFYMMMPNILRESGSFGTHWMLQRSIRVRTGDESEVISGHDMIEVLRALHSQGDGRDLTPGACAVLAWSRRDSSYELGWSELLTAAGTTNPPLVCAANGSVARNLTVR
jgi:hypothetical protein